MTSPSIAQMFDLSGQTALVTGAAQGLGKAIALRLAEAGAAIVALAPASRLRRSIHPVLAVISSLPGRAPQFERR